MHRGSKRDAGRAVSTMHEREQGRAAWHEPSKEALRRLPWALGYSLTSTWATVLLFSSFFSKAPSSAVVTISMLSGVIACLGALFLHAKTSLFSGRSGTSSLYATGVAVGTFMCTFPSLASIAPAHDVGLVVSGFFAILLILTWFEAFSRLPSRTIVFLGGCSFLLSAAGVFAILSMPVEAASIAMSALPLVSFSLLPKPLPESGTAANNRATLGKILAQAVSWKTLLGIAISFFVIGAMGALAPELGVAVELSPIYLGIPALLTLVFVLTARLCPQRLDAAILFKLLLVGVAGIAFLLVYAGSTNLTLVFFLYITADVLLWSVLALAAKRTPVAPHAVFACGWLAECAGNVLGHNVAVGIGDTSLLFALVMLLVLVAVGFAFGDGLFMIELDEESGGLPGAANTGAMQSTGKAPSNVAAPDDACDATPGGIPSDAAPASLGGAPGTADRSPSISQADAIAAFAARYGLSERETDVFALWVTGHGLKHIQNTLFISESTVKTHLRSIYRKCDTHNRAEIIALFEGER